MDMTEETIQELMAFLDSSVTSYHAVETIQNTLIQEGFTALSEKKIWTLDQGGSYFVMRNDSSVIVCRLPDCEVHQIKGFHVYAAHSDSPALKIKENPELDREGVYVSINTELYGNMILSTWFDRPLTIAGRVCVEETGEIVTKTVRLKDNLCMIPSLAIHMNRNINKGVAYSPQSDMLPLLTMMDPARRGSTAKGVLRALLADALGTQEILSYDLYVANCEKAVLAGVEGEFLMTPRYDDLACVFAGLKGILGGKPSQYID
ncbi:MAG: M18 family aminopeptidase, partial [Lachnospiraceae bacterium]|nr:M18 family aminopeptidase [Lachnospiraceae bacterium]